ncbi:CheR family methyltransferase [Vannielia litorea]|uniref:CheR family methyltransferase n=1 Tax=Vannielia litorea TaxID=1217970 RepID=UPI0021BDB898|nr:chemotaxis protein CheB [Vannielia litorea]
MGVVAVAASAGGLEATSLMAKSLALDVGCCYVIAQHMSPHHKSMLVELLSRETELKILELEDDTKPSPNIVYIPPPGKDVIFSEGHFRLTEPVGHQASPKPSADRLFTSLATNFGRHVIGVVLSGTGSDGSYGIQAIRENGGITIAQEPASCKYDGMPTSAIKTGCVDLILTPQQIGERIATIRTCPDNLEAVRELQKGTQQTRDLFQILLSQTLVDFRNYKESTFNRRIHRRMVSKGILAFEDYVAVCRQSPDEVHALYRDLLISVTRFFRDGRQFELLANNIKKRVDAKDRGKPIRVWVAGCATGEEAYSVAITLVEAMGGLSELGDEDLQVFATDIDESSLDVARQGSYPVTALADIPNALVANYFDVKGERIVVKQKLRSTIMFSRHNVFQDPPFISMDLVTLRNVLIYFNTTLQERVLTRIAYSLQEDGLLFLGSSETVGAMERSFVHIEPEGRVFKKRDPKSQAALVDFSFKPYQLPRDNAPHKSRAHIKAVDDWEIFDVVAGAVLQDGLLINRSQTVLRIFGDLAAYSTLTKSTLGQNTLSILKRPLAMDAASLSLVAVKNNEQKSGQWHELEHKPGSFVQITAYPVPENDHFDERLIMIGFRAREKSEPRAEGTEHSAYVTFLEEELSQTRDALQVTIEQLQTSNEELQSVNEELQSSNEELQSTNEELQTSNEELQSTNEELITVNEEMLVNASQLERTTAELGSVIENTPTTLLMLDTGLVIRHASSMARETFGLQGRSLGLGHLSQAEIPRGYPNLVEICSNSLVDRQTSKESFTTGTTSNTLHIAPIQNSAEDLLGLVVLVDNEANMPRLMAKIRSMSRIGTWRLNASKGTSVASVEVLEMMGRTAEENPLSLDDEMRHVHPDDRQRVRECLECAIRDLADFEYVHRLRHKNGNYLQFEVSGHAFRDTDSQDVLVVGVMRNYSEGVLGDALLRQYDEITTSAEIGLFSYDVRFAQSYWNRGLRMLLGIDPDEEPDLERMLAVFAEDSKPRIGAQIQHAIDSGEGFQVSVNLSRADGSDAALRCTASVSSGVNGRTSHVYGAFQQVFGSTG